MNKKERIISFSLFGIGIIGIIGGNLISLIKGEN